MYQTGGPSLIRFCLKGNSKSKLVSKRVAQVVAVAVANYSNKFV